MHPSYLRVSLRVFRCPNPRPSETTPLAGAPAVSLPLGAPSAALAAPGGCIFFRGENESSSHLEMDRWLIYNLELSMIIYDCQ